MNIHGYFAALLCFFFIFRISSTRVWIWMSAVQSTMRSIVPITVALTRTCATLHMRMRFSLRNPEDVFVCLFISLHFLGSGDIFWGLILGFNVGMRVITQCSQNVRLASYREVSKVYESQKKSMCLGLQKSHFIYFLSVTSTNKCVHYLPDYFATITRAVLSKYLALWLATELTQAVVEFPFWQGRGLYHSKAGRYERDNRGGL